MEPAYTTAQLWIRNLGFLSMIAAYLLIFLWLRRPQGQHTRFLDTGAFLLLIPTQPFLAMWYEVHPSFLYLTPLTLNFVIGLIIGFKYPKDAVKAEA